MKKSLHIFSGLIVMLLLSLSIQTSFAQLTVVSESFDGAAFTPAGWSLDPVIAPGPGAKTSIWTRRTNGNTQYQLAPHSGTGMASFRSTNTGNPPGNSVSGDHQSLVTPSFDLQSRGAASASVSFWMYRDSLLATNQDSISIYMDTVAVYGASSVWLGTIVRNRTIGTAAGTAVTTDGWYQYTVAYPASFVGATNHILFKGVAEQGVRMYIDDVSYDTYPLSCSGTPNVGNILSGLSVICNGGGNTTLSLQAPIVGLGGVVYQWQSSSSSAGPWTNVGTGADTLHTGNMTSTTFFQCVVNCLPSSTSYTTPVDSVIIRANTNPTISVNGTTSFCAGGSTLLVASGASTYTWTPSASISNAGGVDMDSVNAAPTNTTNYTITGFDALGCSGTANVNVNVNPAPVLNATAYPMTGNTPLSVNSICSGDSIRLNAIPGGGGNPWTYSWSDGKTTRIDTVHPTITTTYVVTATVTATGCTSTDTIVITVNSGTPPVVTLSPAGPLAICDATPTLIIASGASTYTWAPGASVTNVGGADMDSVNIAPAANTVYTITGTSAGACPGTTTLTVTAGASPVLNATAYPMTGNTPLANDTVCNGTQVRLNSIPGGGANPWTYLWSDSKTTRIDTVTITATTTFTVIATNAAGCMGYDTIVMVSGGAAPTVTFNPPSPATTCNGTPVLVVASGANTYTWTNAGPPSVTTNAAGDSATCTPTNPTNYTVTANNGSCNATFTYTVNAGSTPVLNATVYPLVGNFPLATDTVCEGDSLKLNAIPFGGGNPWSYLWTDGNTNRIDTIEATATTQQYIVTATDNGGCGSSSDTINLVVVPHANANFFVTHNGTACIFTDASVGATSWHWDFGDGTTNINQNPNYTYASYGTYTVQLIITNPCGDDTSTQTVVVDSTSNVGIQNASINVSNVGLYPNPANNMTTLVFTAKDNAAQYAVVNAIGQQVISGKLTSNSNNQFRTVISTKELPTGTYSVKIMTDSGTATTKLLKQ